MNRSFAVRMTCVLGMLCLTLAGRAALQFDVFLGYGGQPTGLDGVVRGMGWFPVGCEVHHDGPSFNAVFELRSGQFGNEEVRRFPIELPTNTRKRFVFPVFSSGTHTVWEARLLDERGRVVAEHVGLRPKGRSLSTLVVGALPRTFAGIPKLPEFLAANRGGVLEPYVARLQVEVFPENTLALEGLDAIYLNSSRALELRSAQGDALAVWVRGGGHLVLAVEDPAEVKSLDWLTPLLPGALSDMYSATVPSTFVQWVNEGRQTSDGRVVESEQPSGGRSVLRPYESAALWRGGEVYTAEGLGISEMPDAEWRETRFPAVRCRARDARTVLSGDGEPLILRSSAGRGLVTLMLFSPERQPFVGWDEREWFWARVFEVPADWYVNQTMNDYGQMSVDGWYGVMLDTRQVRKLPLPWLLLLLVIYLLVIGPVDRFWLKKINRQMLTWVTFPIYVVFFSVLIWYIGYRLRAGERECNEVHIIDVVPRAPGGEWRGHTYASVYSPKNALYEMGSDQPYASLRGEFQGTWGGSRDSGRLTVDQRGDGFRGEVFIPVWMSRLYTADWYAFGSAPLSASLRKADSGHLLQVRNEYDTLFNEVWAVVGQRVYELGQLGPGAETQRLLDRSSGGDLSAFLSMAQQRFERRVEERRRAFAIGGDISQWPGVTAENLLAVSLVGSLERDRSSQQYGGLGRYYLQESRMDVTSLLARDQALVFAWVKGQAPVASICRSPMSRGSEDTLFRIAVPIEPDSL